MPHNPDNPAEEFCRCFCAQLRGAERDDPAAVRAAYDRCRRIPGAPSFDEALDVCFPCETPGRPGDDPTR